MKKLPLIVKIFIGFVLGTGLGLVFSKVASPDRITEIIAYVRPLGSILIALLKMVVFPIILFSLIVGTASMPLKKSGKLGISVLLWYFTTSLFATIFGIALAYVFNPTMQSARKLVNEDIKDLSEMAGVNSPGSFGDFLTGLFQNPFSALADGQFLPIIIFAIFFGLCARAILDAAGTTEKTRAAVETLIRVCDGAQTVSFKMISCVMHYFPIGAFALSFVNFAQNGFLLVGPYAKITLCVFVGTVSMILVIYPLVIFLFCRENPYRVLFRMREAVISAFVTRSSAASLPVSFKVADELGIDRRLSSFSLPLGATVNMDGVCVCLPVFVILASNMFGYAIGPFQVAKSCILIMFASVGAGGIPGGSIFLLFMVLENMGLKGDQVSVVVALYIGINAIVDMFETCCNVTGDNVCTYVVAKKNEMITP